MNTLLLVDGSSYLYRAFHAMPDLRSPEGLPTGAVHGVLNMLRRLRKDYNAECLACVFDAKGKTFRDEWYPEYKANRPPMPDDLRVQVEPLFDAIRAQGWPLLVIDGVEADDVIGTLARQASGAGWRCVISTGDKDMAQLVDGQVTLINTMTNEVLDEAGVINKFGVPANRIVDYLTLVGDKVDNVPGVDKCGEKTAVKWLTEYDSLDGVVANADAIKGVVGNNLRAALERLPLSRKLVTIRTDVALPMPFDALHPAAADVPTLRTLYQRLGFASLLKELDAGPAPAATPTAAPPAPAADATPGHYETILSEDALLAWRDRLLQADLICLDTETTSLDPLQAQLVGLSFSVIPGQAAYLPLGHTLLTGGQQLDRQRALDVLRPILEDASRPKVGQNLKYDCHVLANAGITLRGIRDDTYLEAYVLEAHRPRDMDALARRHLGYQTLTYAEVCGKGAKQIGFEEVDLETATRYAAEDADITLRLHRQLSSQVTAVSGLARVYRDIELPALSVLWRMERQGVLIDTAKLAGQSHELGLRLNQLEAEVHQLAGQPFNLNSPKQIGEILFERQGLPVKKKTASGAPSTDEDVLSQLAEDYPLPRLLLEYRSLAKLKSTYLDKLPVMVNPRTGRVHTNYNQTGAVTGRLASTDPNLQNIPVRTVEGRRIREAFIAPLGWRLVAADYSQIELRIMAHLSQDANLLAAFAAGLDVHRATAAEIFGCSVAAVSTDQRRAAKAINFGLIYGMSAFGLARELGIDRSAAQLWMDRYFARYPGVARYMEDTRQAARSNGYVETVFGRRLWMEDIQAGGGPRRQAAERAAINAPMQGTAADIIKLAMARVQNWLDQEGLQARLIMQVHDELVLEVPTDEVAQVRAELPQQMAAVADLAVPLVVDTGEGDTWEEAH